MEDPQWLLDRVVKFAGERDGIDAVIQTGSRARNQRVDAFSDLDIELIGPEARSLAGRDDWQEEIAPVLVSLHFLNDQPGAPPWANCLVVFEAGRKVDFTLAAPDRLVRLKEDGLDDIYQRGYVVHVDRLGLADGLSPSRPSPPAWRPPAADEFVSDQREFWFEATQVPIYVARGEAWPALARLATCREILVTMLEWRTGAESRGTTDTWYLGYHLAEWLDAGTREQVADLFPSYNVERILSSLRVAIRLYADAARVTGELLSLPVLDLRNAVENNLDAIIDDSR